MDYLFLLQFACLIIMVMLAATLALSRLQMPRLHRRYEQSRRMLCIAMLILAVHYLLQMTQGLRASGEHIGAMVNILFYTPAALLISLSVINLTQIRMRRILCIGISGYVIILLVYTVGRLLPGVLVTKVMLYTMETLFFLYVAILVVIDIVLIRRSHRRISDEVGGDMLPYDQYMWSGIVMLGASALMLSGAMMSRLWLYIVAPIGLVSLIVFVNSFIGLGYNYASMTEVLKDDNSEDGILLGEDDKPDETETLTPTRSAAIDAALTHWCDAGKYRNTSANMATLSADISIPRHDLSVYFKNSEYGNFRIWLSEIRFRQACRLLREKPQYSNEAISQECGFSSNAHLYKVFKAKTGTTPGKWKISDATHE